MNMKRTLPAFLAAALAAACTGFPAGAAYADRTVQESVPAESDARVEIDLFGGTLKVIGWEKNEIEVSGTLSPDSADLLIDAGKRRIEISADWGETRRPKGPPTGEITVRMPRGGEVSVSGVNLSVEVEGVNGDVDVESVNGDLSVRGTPAAVFIESVNGTITVDATTDDLEVDSVSGNITVRGARGSVSVETVSGDITLVAERVDDGNFSSVSGGISFDASLDEDAQLDVESHSGTVILTLPADVSARFQVETFNGDIRSEFGEGRRTEEDFGLGRSMELRVGDGGAEVSVTTFSGDVVLRKK